jgi:prepilin-type N-terminal cleavage/methylation domain-containing protein
MSERKTGGFTLIEVLVALGVFAFAVLGMMGALNALLESAREARFHEIVRHRLENHLALYEGGQLKEVNRKVELDSPKMTITETVRRDQVINSERTVLQGFWRVTVVAEWVYLGEKQKEEASILRYGQ